MAGWERPSHGLPVRPHPSSHGPDRVAAPGPGGGPQRSAARNRHLGDGRAHVLHRAPDGFRVGRPRAHQAVRPERLARVRADQSRLGRAGRGAGSAMIAGGAMTWDRRLSAARVAAAWELRTEGEIPRSEDADALMDALVAGLKEAVGVEMVAYERARLVREFGGE